MIAPPYNRTPDKWICHIGLGNFHRAHHALYLHKLLEAGQADGWGICGIGLMPGDAPLLTALRAQDHLYTLCEREGDESTLTTIGAIMDSMDASADMAPALARLVDPRCHIVSLTITEKGYDPAADGTYAPHSAIGLITHALQQRFASGVAPFTVVSCDNLIANGEKARAAILKCATTLDPALASRIAAEVAFPLSMVDRITPAANAAHHAHLQERWHITDPCAVVCEAWCQWVLEDTFCAPRPPYEKAGVTLSSNVKAYEDMKIGLLNGAHAALSHAGLLLGFTHVDAAARHPRLADWITRYMDCVQPTLHLPEGVDIAAYKTSLLKRFQNTAIKDTLGRLAEDSSSKFPLWLGPPLTTLVENGNDATPLLQAVALWITHLRHMQTAEGKAAYEAYLDQQKDRLIARATQEPLTTFLTEAMKLPPTAADQIAPLLEDALTKLNQSGAQPKWRSTKVAASLA